MLKFLILFSITFASVQSFADSDCTPPSETTIKKLLGGNSWIEVNDKNKIVTRNTIRVIANPNNSLRPTLKLGSLSLSNGKICSAPNGIYIFSQGRRVNVVRSGNKLSTIVHKKTYKIISRTQKETIFKKYPHIL